jgi:hypothetical protein
MEDISIKNSVIAKRAKPTKIRVLMAMTPALISKITINQNGIQMSVPHMIPLPRIE